MSRHRQYGFSGMSSRVIPNGVDLNTFKPKSVRADRLRAELRLAENDQIVGHVARYHPMKDHRTFLKAFSQVAKARDNCYAVLVGKGVEQDNPLLSELIQKLGIGKCVFLLGRRLDMAEITPSFDVAVSSSAYGEGFSNAVAEAMACGVPCIVTDIGDSARIVGETGIVVSPRNKKMMAGALNKLIDLNRRELKKLRQAARRRIANRYSIDRVCGQYEKLYISEKPR